MKISIGPKTILHPHPVLIVGTYDASGKANAATVAWGGICCSKPPAVSVSLREATQSYHNIKARKAFTVNIPAEGQERFADYVGVVSGKDTDKFANSGFTAVKPGSVDAPSIAEFPVSLECKLIHELKVGLHTLFVGEIVDVLAHVAVLGENGMPDITKVKPLVYATGNQGYFGIGAELMRAFTVKSI